ncbi:MAG: pyrroloquinoline quinone-dependent dehydrogenase, partial [Verrucomicrobiaceae bacterium]
MKFFAPLLIAAVAQGADTNWAAYLGDKGGSHYSTLTQITPENVTKLQVAWTFNAGGADPKDRSQIQCNPLVVDGVLYGTSPDFQLIAVDAATGGEKWRFDPAQEGLAKSGVNRGVVHWGGGDDARILYANDRFLHAIDLRSGKRIPSFGKNGSVDLKEGLGREAGDLYLTANTPGVIYRDLLIMGMRLGEGPGPAAPGPIRAYNVRTGELVWRFNTIPQPGEPGHGTWPPDAYRRLGGANVWSGFTLD